MSDDFRDVTDPNEPNLPDPQGPVPTDEGF